MPVELPELPDYWVWEVERVNSKTSGVKYEFRVYAHHVVLRDMTVKPSTVQIRNLSDVDKEFNEAYRLISADAFKKDAEKNSDAVVKSIETHLEALGASPWVMRGEF